MTLADLVAEVILLTHWTWEETLDNMTASRFKALQRRNQVHVDALSGKNDNQPVVPGEVKMTPAQMRAYCAKHFPNVLTGRKRPKVAQHG